VDYNITIKEVQDYAEYYFAIRTILKEKPMSFKEWKEKQDENKN
tara:strand:- start:26 stop:157 length:132 start_codon:yes stop_codon:yes gene_type:complete